MVRSFRDKVDDQKPVLIGTSATDTECSIKKEFVSHWLFKGVNRDFMVENDNAWDVHPANIRKEDLPRIQACYTTMAETMNKP